MCGIAGFSLNPESQNLSPAHWIRTLGLEIESRGWDATGVLTVNHKGRLRIAKAPVDATKFFDQRRDLGSTARLALIHTRLTTQGKKENNLNNHPVKSGPIIGIHNGMIDNDHSLYAKHRWQRNGQVDSEAIFAAIANLGIFDGLEAIEGSMAVAWVDETDPETLWLARGCHSPLYVHTFNQGTFFASTAQALGSLTALKIEPEEIKEGTLLAIRDGAVVARDTFKPQPPRWNGYVHSRANVVSSHDGAWTNPSIEPQEYRCGDKVRAPFSNITGTVTSTRWNSRDGWSYQVQWDCSTWEGYETLARAVEEEAF